MRFTSPHAEEPVTSREQLLQLVEAAVRDNDCFALGDDNKHCLAIVQFSDEGALLELHRGKRRDAWLSPPIDRHEISRILVEYYQSGDLADDRLNGNRPWDEVGVAHPVIYVLLAITAIGGAVYHLYF